MFLQFLESIDLIVAAGVLAGILWKLYKLFEKDLHDLLVRNLELGFDALAREITYDKALELVQWAEQTMKSESGQAKFDAVESALQDYLQDMGISVNLNDIRKLIESAVYEATSQFEIEAPLLPLMEADSEEIKQ